VPSPLRVVVAAIAGYAAAALLGTLGAAGLAAALGSATRGPRHTALLALTIAVRFVAAIAAGYIGARLAPAGRVLVTVALVVLLFLGITIATYRAAAEHLDPPGYVPLVALLGVIGIWTGAMIDRATHGRDG